MSGMELAGNAACKEAPMAARAMWKADLALGELKVPVKLYSAVQDTKVHFRLLHAADHAPVKQQMVDPESEQPVASAETQKSRRRRSRRLRAIDRGRASRADAETVAADQRRAGRRRRAPSTSAGSTVRITWGPTATTKVISRLPRCSTKRDAVGIAHWVLRNKSYVGALQASGGYLLLDTLRYAQADRRGRTRCGPARIVRRTSARSRWPSS